MTNTSRGTTTRIGQHEGACVLPALLLVLCSTCVAVGPVDAEPALDPATIFTRYGKSVVMVMQVLYFDPQNASHPKYISEIEKVFETELLGAHVPIVTGSGFFIDTEGLIITNFHVIDSKDIDVTKKIVYRNFIGAIENSLEKFSFKTKQLERVEDDLWRLIEHAEWSYQVRVNDTEIFTPEVVASDEELDIALLKINEAGRFMPVRPLVVRTVKVGEPVVVVGYPLPDVMQTLFKDYQASLTTGNISTIRDDKWGLQHTASLNSGNSGGPLFNMKGDVIGVNVAKIRDASNIYFSIPIRKVIEWMEKKSDASGPDAKTAD